MKYSKDWGLHSKKRHINENGRNTRTKRPKLAPRAGILPAKFQLLGPSGRVSVHQGLDVTMPKIKYALNKF